MTAFTVQICEKILELIQSRASDLPEVAGGWNAAVRYQFYADSTDLDTLEVSIVPGSLVCENLTRDGGKVQFVVGVSLGKKLDSDDEIPELAAFSEMLFLYLRSFPAFQPDPDKFYRGVELSTVSTESIYSNETLDSIRTYDSLIVLTFNVYFRKGGLS